MWRTGTSRSSVISWRRKLFVPCAIRNVMRNKHSTLAISFSCDGALMASGHLSHQILVHQLRPHPQFLRALSHPSSNRSPWCLTFHLRRPHLLLSGCLGGSVLLWDAMAGKCLCVWLSGISCPINGLVFLPSSPDHHILVACDACLYLLYYSNEDQQMEVAWSTKTSARDVKVRLVLHHPESSSILTAITNISQSRPGTMSSLSKRSSYRLQLYHYSIDKGPDLENSSLGLITMSARVLSPQSVLLTSQLVVSSSLEVAGSTLSIHSIRRESFGQCIYTTLVAPSPSSSFPLSTVSMDLSPCGGFLLLTATGKRFLYHMESHYTNMKVFRVVSEAKSSLKIELCCEMGGVYSANVARWMPPESVGVGGVCVGTQQGGMVLWWSGGKWRGSGGEGGGGGGEDITRTCKLEWFGL